MNEFAVESKNYYMLMMQAIQKKEKELYLYAPLVFSIWYIDHETLTSIFKKDFGNFIMEKERKDLPSNYEY
jgi:hypothetical protein